MSGPAFVPVRASLVDVVGEDHLRAVCDARSVLTGEPAGALWDRATEVVDFFPGALEERLVQLLPSIGQVVVEPSRQPSASGATSRAFQAASHLAAAPLSGLGYYRIGEGGRLHFTTKSEHYHTPVGHSFPGYQLVDRARSLGIPNATHNNTRGHITRLLEEQLVLAARGADPGDTAALSDALGATGLRTLNRVLNLETGSLAVEAAFKMCLARFYLAQEGAATPAYAGRIPVFLVIADDAGKPVGNYHGTTALVQTLRGLWPGLSDRMAELDLFRFCAIRPNNLRDLEQAFAKWERPPYKIAGFFHEIVMMNYGARVLGREFLQRAYALCDSADVPTLCDEIQSCLWAPGLFLFREFGLAPTFASVGKGFPGGEYPASRILFAEGMDNLSQFGALVTNGQEELASLAYLVTMRWAQANAEVIRKLGDRYAGMLADLCDRHPSLLDGIEGHAHLSGLRFTSMDAAGLFAAAMNEIGYDLSAQTYKADCPPVVLTKLPLIVGVRAMDHVIGAMDGVLAGIDAGGHA